MHTACDRGEGSAISLQHGNTQTGRLSSRTLLHKRYVIMRTIGQGGMAAVYQARDMRHNTICAIKEMSLSSLPAHERGQAIQNFLAEATILSRLNHPNLPAFTDFFSEGSRHFLVMEYIEGRTLEELLERNGSPFPERCVLGWARQLCNVLEYLHSQQPPIIFRDLKPGNIMLRNDGRIKLIDFGIARIFRRSGTHDTQMLGTPGFAPPEQYGTAQTDERSDMYSLAMSLFQLLTNTLTEQGFGLLDVRSINPDISPSVAYALERATDPEPENRFESIAVFQRALLGEGIFVFERGNPATTPEELAELCACYPEEAADYLLAGEIEDWLQDIGSSDLARVTRRIRVTTGDPHMGVEKFVQAVMGPTARVFITGSGLRSTGSMRSIGSSISQSASIVREYTSEPMIEVRPDKLDFGQVNPGISSPMLLYIVGNKGRSVRGTIQPVEPWIIVDTQYFDGLSTLVRVRIDSTDLHDSNLKNKPVSTHYQGSILIQPAGERAEYHIPVVVDVLSLEEILNESPLHSVSVRSTGPSTMNREAARPYPSSIVEEDDDEDETLVVGRSIAPHLIATASVMATREDDVDEDETLVGGRSIAHELMGAASDLEKKYGKPNNGNGSASANRNAAQVLEHQHMWLKRGLTFAAAFMAASFSYMFLAHLPSSAQSSLLPPSHGFIAVLLGMIPLGTIGALAADLGDATNRKWNTLNRFCTGLGLTLASLGLGEFLWHALLGVSLPVLHLCTMLLLTAGAATIGTNPMTSQQIVEQVSRGVSLPPPWFFTVRLLIIAAAVVIGGGLGFMLTMGLAFGWLSPLAILLGIGVMLILVMRVDRLVKQP
jgi:serine/threonine protein kinase